MGGNPGSNTVRNSDGEGNATRCCCCSSLDRTLASFNAFCKLTCARKWSRGHDKYERKTYSTAESAHRADGEVGKSVTAKGRSNEGEGLPCGAIYLQRGFLLFYSLVVAFVASLRLLEKFVAPSPNARWCGVSFLMVSCTLT